MKRILLVGLVLLLLGVLGTVAVAQEHKPESAAHEETIAQSIGKWLNFLALVAILYMFLKRGLKVDQKFKSNFEEIQRSIEIARQAKEEAENRLKELEERMTRMNDEVAGIKETASREAEAERKRILESAQREAERIVEFAHREIDTEVRMARKELRRHVADLAVAESRKIIQTEMNDQDQNRILESYIKDFSK